MSEEKKKKPILKKEDGSALNSFIKRPVANKDEIRKFEDTVKKEYRNEQIEENLSNIYKNKDGNIVDVSRLNIKKKKTFLRKLFNLIIFALIISGTYLGYNWYVNDIKDSNGSLILEVISPETITAGKEFSYNIKYKNPSKVGIKNIVLEIIYPNNFIPTLKEGEERKSLWDLGSLLPGEERALEISGKIIDKKGAPSTIKTIISYIPDNFSSEFKVEKSVTTIIDNIGFNTSLNYFNTALVGTEQEVVLVFNTIEENYISNFDLIFNFPDNIELIESSLDIDNESEVEGDLIAGDNQETDEKKGLKIESIERYTWHVVGLENDKAGQEISFKYKVKEKVSDKQNITFYINQENNGETYNLQEKVLDLNVMKSDLNLTLMVNDSKNGEAISFGDFLNYSIIYNNQGESSLEDVTIMLVVDSDLLDWNNIEDENNGEINSNTIAWSKEQITSLEEIKPGDEGRIEFLIPVKSFFNADTIDKNLEVKSYAQFNFMVDDTLNDQEDNQSNIIVNPLNSNLNFSEKILYFTEDNIPVGSGPLPPRVNNKTKFRVYWDIENSLHDLSSVNVNLNLPEYISFDRSISVDKGFLSHNENNNSINWKIDNLSNFNDKIEASFDIILNPKESDLDKILVISEGANIVAFDDQTKRMINKKENATTSKLEEDEIANLSSDGIVKE
ncbi:hypothetical protein EOL94_02145 [bacterium]|nr:hypothetical protein [bacterium]